MPYRSTRQQTHTSGNADYGDTADADTNRSTLQSLFFVRVCKDVITNRREPNANVIYIVDGLLASSFVDRCICYCRCLVKILQAKPERLQSDVNSLNINICRRSGCSCWPSIESVVLSCQRSFKLKPPVSRRACVAVFS